ncbi:hypothetical protein P7E02_10570 [Enterococcus hulanensis]|uniref:hypothetical protein n=1 Tax=Enterococcus hulanensis TaxID=2559929 RepID=UPI0028907037|nr:hypothetical protein [Enterococcus hulanensis]MDT2660316.1 hypothetical protein [Enterococcus hulanensis]
MSKPKVIFVLYHIYERTFDGIDWRERKRIGFFNTRKECKDVIGTMKDSKGFRDHPVTCFKIFEYEVGKTYWRDEF